MNTSLVLRLVCLLALVILSVDSSSPWRRSSIRKHDGRTVSEFGIKGLCNSHRHQRLFRKTLKHKICHLSDEFIREFVRDLCAQKHEQLEAWVAETFDIDGNGYISYSEERPNLDKPSHCCTKSRQY